MLHLVIDYTFRNYARTLLDGYEYMYIKVIV